MDRNEVDIAFEILLEEIEVVANSVKQEGASAFHEGNYERVRQIIEDATRLAEFRAKVKDLQKEWQKKFPDVSEEKTERDYQGRLPRGLRTPDDAFREPILRSLMDLGGSAEMNAVLDRVSERMGDQLNEYDAQPLKSDPNSIRWRNTAQWCRHSLVQDGLMKSDSPRGVWEISEAGRKALESGDVE